MWLRLNGLDRADAQSCMWLTICLQTVEDVQGADSSTA